jgi:hypothetical protein
MLPLFFLLTVVPARFLVPLTEVTWFWASATALVEPADREGDNNEDQSSCYKIRHAMNSTLIDHETYSAEHPASISKKKHLDTEE